MESDLTLALASRAGERTAFDKLYARYQPLISNWAARALRDRMAAEDVAQKVMLRVHSYLDHFDPDRAPFIAWVKRIARNCIRTEMARLRRDDGCGNIDDILESELGGDDDPVRDYEWQRVREQVAQLPAKQRQAVELCYFQGFTFSAAAREIGVSEHAIRYQLKCAFARLRGPLADLGLGFGKTCPEAHS